MPRLVDAHCHASTRWFEPVDTLLFAMDRSGVERAVLVQMLGEHDNTYQEACRVRHPDRLSSVVGIDVSAPSAPMRLEELVAGGARGLRLRPTDRSPGADPYAIWRVAERLGVAVSCTAATADLLAPDFAELLEALPELTVVIEHLGASGPDRGASAIEQRRGVFALARFARVRLKVHGIGEIANRAMPPSDSLFEEPTPDVLLDACRAFGAGRMLWGSDFPPVAAREGYANALDGAQRALSFLSDKERAAIFGGNADALFFEG